MKKRIWAAVLTLVLVSSTFLLSACNSKNNKPVTTSPGNDADNTPHYVDAIPPIDYKGEDFIIVSPSRSWAHVEMTADAYTADVINDAIFKRTLAVNDRLNINLVDHIVTSGSVTNYVRIDIETNTYTYDLMLSFPNEALTMYQSGWFVDQAKIDSINLSNPWWESTFNDEVNVSNARYVTYNQSNLILYSGFYVWAFNKSIVAANEGLKSPYDLIEENNWTWDTAYEMMKTVATDNNADGTPSAADGDTLGLVGHINHSQNQILASGATIGSRNSNGVLRYNGLSQRYISAFEKFTNYFIASDECAISGTSDFTGYTSAGGLANYINYFNEGKALFLSTGTSEITSIRESGVEYGIVVLPKYESSQTDFITPVYKGVDGFAVPKRATSEDLNVIGTVMETLGAYSYKNLIDIHIGTVLHYRAANDPTAQEMINLAYANPIIDVCLANNFGGCSKTCETLNKKGEANCSSAFLEIKKMISEDIRKAIESSDGN